jgi:hypothetical protein
MAGFRAGEAAVYTGRMKARRNQRSGNGRSPRSASMTWETPEFVELKMDAEINSYQDDFGGDRDTGV